MVGSVGFHGVGAGGGVGVEVGAAGHLEVVAGFGFAVGGNFDAVQEAGVEVGEEGGEAGEDVVYVAVNEGDGNGRFFPLTGQDFCFCCHRVSILREGVSGFAVQMQTPRLC